MMKPRLILTVGLPRSGKSTWCEKMRKRYTAVIVNPDSVRLAIHGQAYIREAEQFVWATVRAMVKALFIAGHELVILDATSVTKPSRDSWKSDDWDLWYAETDVNKFICKRRAEEGDRLDLVPVIEDMSERYDLLDSEEREKDVFHQGMYSEARVNA